MQWHPEGSFGTADISVAMSNGAEIGRQVGQHCGVTMYICQSQ